MKFLAYIIWLSLGTCVVLGIGACAVATLRNRRKSDNTTATPQVETQSSNTPVDLERWNRLAYMFQLNISSLPSSDAQRLAWAQEYLGIKPQWLHGEDTAMFEFLSFHNNVEAGVEFIDSLREKHPQTTLYVAKPCGVPLEEQIMEACAVLCFAHPAQIEGTDAQRYYPVNVSWEWGYPPERVQCSQILYAAVRAGFELKGVEVETAELYALLEGQSIPAVMLTQAQQSWDPNAQANTGEDLAAVKKGMLSTREFSNLVESRNWG